MKQLEKTFVMNADKCGNHTFTQIRREGNIAAYRRNRVSDGSIHSYEVFLVKVVKAGTGYNTNLDAEDYEQYPGPSAFGRHAWSISWGPAGLTRVNNLVESLLKGKEDILPIVETEDETEIVPVIRIGKSKNRRALNFPSHPFPQKELAAFNGIANYKEVYTDLQRFLADGTLVKFAKRESIRGKSAVLFATPAMVEALKGNPVVAVEA
jgi:hypothetical protein